MAAAREHGDRTRHLASRRTKVTASALHTVRDWSAVVRSVHLDLHSGALGVLHYRSNRDAANSQTKRAVIDTLYREFVSFLPFLSAVVLGPVSQRRNSRGRQVRVPEPRPRLAPDSAPAQAQHMLGPVPCGRPPALPRCTSVSPRLHGRGRARGGARQERSMRAEHLKVLLQDQPTSSSSLTPLPGWQTQRPRQTSFPDWL